MLEKINAAKRERGHIKDFDQPADTLPVESRSLEAGDHANQRHFDGGIRGCEQGERRRHEHRQIHAEHEHSQHGRRTDPRERAICCRQIDGLNVLGGIQRIDSVDVLGQGSPPRRLSRRLPR